MGRKSFFQKRFYLLIDLWNYMKIRKKWWLLPLILMLLFVGILIIFGSSTAVSPFIYTLI
jgi:hypothetical protein